MLLSNKFFFITTCFLRAYTLSTIPLFQSDFKNGCKEISRSGYYVLQSNIKVDTDLPLIKIKSDNVTLDLNQFSITNINTDSSSSIVSQSKIVTIKNGQLDNVNIKILENALYNLENIIICSNKNFGIKLTRSSNINISNLTIHPKENHKNFVGIDIEESQNINLKKINFSNHNVSGHNNENFIGIKLSNSSNIYLDLIIFANIKASEIFCIKSYKVSASLFNDIIAKNLKESQKCTALFCDNNSNCHFAKCVIMDVESNLQSIGIKFLKCKNCTVSDSQVSDITASDINSMAVGFVSTQGTKNYFNNIKSINNSAVKQACGLCFDSQEYLSRIRDSEFSYNNASDGQACGISFGISEDTKECTVRNCYIAFNQGNKQYGFADWSELSSTYLINNISIGHGKTFNHQGLNIDAGKNNFLIRFDTYYGANMIIKELTNKNLSNSNSNQFENVSLNND